MQDDPMIGRVFAGHHIDGLIGEGGMGSVYRASHVRLGRVRALKVLPTALAHDEVFRDRFEREWRAAAAIEHNNIVEVLDAGEAEGHLYILMRLVDGPDLGVLLRRDGPLDATRTLRILDQVADALDAAHEVGLVHRDVKPSNILVGPGDRAYLTDFGIAKNTATRGVTKTGFFVGTLDYASPEQIEGRVLDGRTDIYALGGVLYSCLTGQPPFERESEVQVMYAHLRDDPPSPSTRGPGVPATLDSVVARAMAKDPEARYGSCGELVAGLRAGLRARATQIETLPTPAPPTVTEATPSTEQEPQPEEQTAETAQEPAPTPPEPTLVPERLPTVVEPAPTPADPTRAAVRPPPIGPTPADRTTDPARRPPGRRVPGKILAAAGGAALALVGVVAAILAFSGGGVGTVDVEGRVVAANDEKPVAGVKVSAGVVRDTTSASGLFHLDAVPKDESLRFESCAYTARTHDLPSDGERVDVRLEPLPVRGRVTSALTGHGLRASVRGNASTVTTAGGGSFTLYRSCPGEQLRIYRSGFLQQAVRVPDERRVAVVLKAPASVRETFSGGAGWFSNPETLNGGRTYLLNSAYHVKITSTDLWIRVSSEFDPVTKRSDATSRVLPQPAAISVSAEKWSGPDLNSFGLVCESGSDRYYLIQISSSDGGQYSIERHTKGDSFSLRPWAYSKWIRPTAANRLEATCRGGTDGRPVRITFTVNGHRVADVTDRKGFPPRLLGFFARAYDNAGVDVQFDDFVLRRLAATGS